MAYGPLSAMLWTAARKTFTWTSSIPKNTRFVFGEHSEGLLVYISV
jgi:hypothetical protein